MVANSNFQAWGSELNAKFAAVGMVQTADTGQINWSTVAIPGAANTAAGYEIWKLSSGNLYFKIEYGTGQTVAIPSMWITVGTGSNGSGTLTGQLNTRAAMGASNAAITNTSTNYQSYLCATANYFGLSWKIGSASTANMPRQFTAVAQTVDATGTATSAGYYSALSGQSNQMAIQNVSLTASVTGPQLVAQKHYSCFIPNNNAALPGSSLDGSGNNQAYLWWYCIMGTTPMLPLLHMACVLNSDLIVGNTASMTLVGSTPHTYINAGTSLCTDASSAITNSNLGVVMLFE